MATVYSTKDDFTIIDLPGVKRAVVPRRFPILNPDTIPCAESVWVCFLRRGGKGKVHGAIWLEDKPLDQKNGPNEDAVKSAFLANLGSADGQGTCSACPEQPCSHDAMSLFPVFPGSIAESFDFGELDEYYWGTWDSADNGGGDD